MTTTLRPVSARSLALAVLLGCLALSLGPAAPEASATIVRGFSMRGLVAEAHVIVRGVVVDQEAVWDGERRRVYTISTVRVDQALHGASERGELIRLKQMGGSAEGVTQILAGRAPIGLGDELVLFTRTDGAFHYLVGMAQGVWLVVRDAQGTATITRTGAHLVVTPLPYVAASPAPERAPLDRFEAVLADTLADLQPGAAPVKSGAPAVKP